MNTEEIPAWVPAWDVDNAYPGETSDWTLFQWVWAFLRRNPEYRKDYVHFSELPAYYPHGGKTSKWSGISPCPDDDTALRYCDPPALPGETMGQYWERLGDNVNEDGPLEEHLMEYWGVSNLPDPADDDGYLIMGNFIEMPPYLIEIPAYMLEGIGTESDGREHVTLQFDLRFSIKKQPEDAELILNEILERQESIMSLEHPQGSQQVKKWPEILREFDADSVEDTYLGTDGLEHVTLRFNLLFDIPKQIKVTEKIIGERLEQAKSIMHLERVRATGPQLRHLPVYLRAFDARLVEADYLRIGNELFSKTSSGQSDENAKQAAYRAVKAGMDLVKGGYKALLKFHQ